MFLSTKISLKYSLFYHQMSHLYNSTIKKSHQHYANAQFAFPQKGENSGRRRVENHQTRMARYFQAFTRNSRRRGNAKKLSSVFARHANVIRSKYFLSHPTRDISFFFSLFLSRRRLLNARQSATEKCTTVGGAALPRTNYLIIYLPASFHRIILAAGQVSFFIVAY